MAGTADSDPPVITGMGLVCGLGIGMQEVVAGAIEGRCAIGDATALLHDEGYDMPPVKRAALVPNLQEADDLRDTSRSTRYGLIAADEALASSNLVRERLGNGSVLDVAPERVGIVSGSAAPSADLYLAVGQRVLTNGLKALSGRTAPGLSAAAPAATVALRHGLRGPNLAVSAACATGSLVLVAAADQIRAGRADVMVVVAVESAVASVVLSSFAHAGAVTDVCQPFDRNRQGLVFGEGAAAFVIESRAHARARQATPLASILGSSLTDDAHHMWAPDPSSWARTMNLALEDASVTARDINYVSAHAAGTLAGDRAECEALRKALGPRAEEVPVWSTKGMHGHAFGASGSLEIGLTIGLLRVGRVPQTVGLVEPDPACDLDHVPDSGRTGNPGLVLKDSFGFGGTNCVVVVDVHSAAETRMAGRQA